MIAVDTSALMAIVLDEPKAEALIAALEADDDLVISAGTVAKALIVSSRRNVGEEMGRLIEGLGFEVVTVTQASAQRVAQAYRPELIRALDAEEPRASAPSERSVALQQTVLAHQPLRPLAIHGKAEISAGERGDHPSAVGRVLPRDPEDRLIGARQRTPLAPRWPGRPTVDRLTADPRDPSDHRGGAALRDQLAGPGDALSHSQPRKSSPATSTSSVLRPNARSSWRT